MTKRGQVSSVDSQNNTARVVFREFDNSVSVEIPILKFRFSGQVQDTLQEISPGDTVMCDFLGDDFSDGVVLGKV